MNARVLRLLLRPAPGQGAVLALPIVASFAVPLGIAAVALLVAAAWPLGPEGIAASLVREPTLPE